MSAALKRQARPTGRAPTEANRGACLSYGSPIESAELTVLFRGWDGGMVGERTMAQSIVFLASSTPRPVPASNSDAQPRRANNEDQ